MKKIDYFHFEGGDEAVDEAPKKKTGQSTGDKYGPAASEFSLKDNSKITDGIVKERGCTDMLCLIVFLTFLASMLVCVIYCISKGDVGKAFAPYDGNDNICGYTPGFEEYPNIYFTDLIGDPDEIFDSGVCVKSCPANDGDYAESLRTNGKGGSKYTQQIKTSYKTYELLNFCLMHEKDLPPTEQTYWRAAKMALINSSGFIKDLYMSSRAIFWSMGLSFLYCMLYIYLMSAFAEYIAWAIVGLVQIGLLGFSVFAFVQFAEAGDEGVEKDRKFMWLIFGASSSIMTCVFALALFCGFSQLKVAIDIIDASADFLAGTKRVIAVPILYFFCTMIVVILWILANISVWSIGDITPEHNAIPFDKDFKLSDAQKKKVYIMAAFLFFGLLWLYNFFKAKTSFIVMVSASTYYFNSDKDHEGSAEVGLAFKFTYAYHIGSLALGSFVIALIQFIRIVVVYAAKKTAEMGGDNQAVQCAIRCADCILRCVEKICDYINKTAYAYMAISGDSFCSSAWNGFLLNVKHALKFSWANFLANMFIFLGKIGIIVINSFSLYMIMKYITKDIDEGVDIKYPMLVVGFATYMSASLFLGLFDETVIALLHCLCVDVDLNGEPKFGPPTFHDSLTKVEDAKPPSRNKGDKFEKVNDMA